MNFIEKIDFDSGMFGNVEPDDHDYHGVNVSDGRDSKMFEIYY